MKRMISRAGSVLSENGQLRGGDFYTVITIRRKESSSMDEITREHTWTESVPRPFGESVLKLSLKCGMED